MDYLKGMKVESLEWICENQLDMSYEEICDVLNIKKHKEGSDRFKRQLSQLQGWCHFRDMKTKYRNYHFLKFYGKFRPEMTNANVLMRDFDLSKEESHGSGVYVIYNELDMLVYVGETTDFLKSYLQLKEKDRTQENFIFHLMKLPHKVGLTSFETMQECKDYYTARKYLVMHKDNEHIMKEKYEFELEVIRFMSAVLKFSVMWDMSPYEVYDKLERSLTLPTISSLILGAFPSRDFKMTPEKEEIYSIHMPRGTTVAKIASEVKECEMYETLSLKEAFNIQDYEDGEIKMGLKDLPEYIQLGKISDEDWEKLLKRPEGY